MLSYKKFAVGAIALTSACLIMLASLVYIVDPYFHFHAPIDGIPYELGNQRYTNDGLSRHFSYDAIITGTSMTENFLPSQLDQLFQTQSIKISYSNASYREITESLARAFSYNENVKLVVRGLDVGEMGTDVNAMNLTSYPEYLYDDNPWNDINYLLNKGVLVRGLGQTIINGLRGQEMTTMDEYSSWRGYDFGADVVLANYSRPDAQDPVEISLSLEAQQTAYDNVMTNVVALAAANPQVEFYCFYTPYSILYYDKLNQVNLLQQELERIEYVTSLLIQQENIKLFSFIELYDVVSNLDNYMDTIHYSGEISDMMLDYMAEGAYLLTPDNYEAHMEEIKSFYCNYPYDDLF